MFIECGPVDFASFAHTTQGEVRVREQIKWETERRLRLLLPPFAVLLFIVMVLAATGHLCYSNHPWLATYHIEAACFSGHKRTALYAWGAAIVMGIPTVVLLGQLLRYLLHPP